MAAGDRVVIERSDLQALLDCLAEGGRTVLGPVVRADAITYAPITSVGDLPAGVGDEQEPGRYRLRDRDDGALFGYASVAGSWKATFLPPRQLLWRGQRTGGGFQADGVADEPRALALVGVRGCDLAAVAVQDRVLSARWGERPAADAHYARARSDVLVVAVACTAPAGTCFCASAGTGPYPGPGADLILTEVLEGTHRFVVEVVTPAGAEVLERGVPCRPADEQDRSDAAAVVDSAAQRMGRSLEQRGLRDVLLAEPEHPRWDDVASRCLACGNCTLACPTCFCTAIEDVSDLTGQAAERWRVWDSCFTAGFSYVHGGSVRSTTRSRYRQWLTHKLATWHDQFGSSGCVGCGRCLTWCPAAIDITAEAAAIRSTSRVPDRDHSQEA